MSVVALVLQLGVKTVSVLEEELAWGKASMKAQEKGVYLVAEMEEEKEVGLGEK